MSIAVAVKKNGKIAFGTDSLHTFGSFRPGQGNISESKFRKVGNAYLAFTGWGIYNQVLDDILSGPGAVPLENSNDIFKFFMKLWRKLHKEYTFVNDQCQETDSPFGDLDSSFLVVSESSIFHISPNISITEFNKYHAIGSGSDYAIGAVYSVYDSEKTAAEIVRTGVKAAIEHDIYCGGDIVVHEW